MKRSILSRWALAPATIGFLICPLGCGDSDTLESPEVVVPAGAEVLAVFDGGLITAAELDTHILSALGDRVRPKDSDVEWVNQQLREVALDRLLIQMRTQGHAPIPDLENRARELRRLVIAGRFLNQKLAHLEPPDEAALKAAYQKNKQRFIRKHQILVRNIFRRRTPDTRVEVLVEELRGVREQLINGASFSELAKRHSDSQSRHFSGTLGWLTREDLPPQLAEVLFSLEVGVPSEPVVAAEGVHLFLVQDEQMAADFPFEDAKHLLTRELTAQARREVIAELVRDMPPPEDVWRADPEEAKALLEGEDPDAIVLRAGEYEVRVRDLPRLSLQSERSDWGRGLDGLMSMLELRERILSHCRDGGCFDEAEIAREIANRQNRLAAALVRQLELEKRIDPEQLRAHYEDHKQRFSRGLLLRVLQLEIEKMEKPDPNEVMARLEALYSRENVEVADLERLAGKFGGNLQDLGWLDFSRLGSVYQGSLGPIMQLLPGKTAPPLLTEDRFRLLLITGRREPEAMPLAEIRASVVRSFLVSHGQELNRQLEEDLLKKSGFRISARAVDEFFRKLSGDI